MAEFRKTLLDATDRDNLLAVWRKLEQVALAGDLQAMNLYLQYTVGKPTQALELTGPEGQPLGADLIPTIMAALADYPSARWEVAAALRVARDSGRTWDNEEDNDSR
jgi:hypothetical protein